MIIWIGSGDTRGEHRCLAGIGVCVRRQRVHGAGRARLAGISRAAWCPPCRSGAWPGYAADRVAGTLPGRAGCNTSPPFPAPDPGGEAGGGEAGRVLQAEERPR